MQAECLNTTSTSTISSCDRLEEDEDCSPDIEKLLHKAELENSEQVRLIETETQKITERQRKLEERVAQTEQLESSTEELNGEAKQLHKHFKQNQNTTESLKNNNNLLNQHEETLQTKYEKGCIRLSQLKSENLLVVEKYHSIWESYDAWYKKSPNAGQLASTKDGAMAIQQEVSDMENKIQQLVIKLSEAQQRKSKMEESTKDESQSAVAAIIHLATLHKKTEETLGCAQEKALELQEIEHKLQELKTVQNEHAQENGWSEAQHMECVPTGTQSEVSYDKYEETVLHHQPDQQKQTEDDLMSHGKPRDSISKQLLSCVSVGEHLETDFPRNKIGSTVPIHTTIQYPVETQKPHIAPLQRPASIDRPMTKVSEELVGATEALAIPFQALPGVHTSLTTTSAMRGQGEILTTLSYKNPLGVQTPTPAFQDQITHTSGPSNNSHGSIYTPISVNGQPLSKPASGNQVLMTTNTLASYSNSLVGPCKPILANQDMEGAKMPLSTEQSFMSYTPVSANHSLDGVQTPILGYQSIVGAQTQIQGYQGIVGAQTQIPGYQGIAGAHTQIPGYQYIAGAQTQIPGYQGRVGAQTQIPGYQGIAGAQTQIPGYQGIAGAHTQILGYQGIAGAQTQIPGYQGRVGAQTQIPGYQGIAGAQTQMPGYQGIAGAQTQISGYQGIAGAQTQISGYQGIAEAQTQIPRYQSIVGAQTQILGYQGIARAQTQIPHYQGTTGASQAPMSTGQGQVSANSVLVGSKTPMSADQGVVGTLPGASASKSLLGVQKANQTTGNEPRADLSHVDVKAAENQIMNMASVTDLQNNMPSGKGQQEQSATGHTLQNQEQNREMEYYQQGMYDSLQSPNPTPVASKSPKTPTEEREGCSIFSFTEHSEKLNQMNKSPGEGFLYEGRPMFDAMEGEDQARNLEGHRNFVDDQPSFFQSFFSSGNTEQQNQFDRGVATIFSASSPEENQQKGSLTNAFFMDQDSSDQNNGRQSPATGFTLFGDQSSADSGSHGNQAMSSKSPTFSLNFGMPSPSTGTVESQSGAFSLF